MNHKLLETFLVNSPPPQFAILDKLLAIFSEGTYLDSAYIRGSMATNRYDRASDVDLILIVDDRAYESFIESINILLSQHFTVLRPGWLDKIVPNFGGLGFVYLVASDNQLFQLDLYVLPLSLKENTSRIPKATVIFRGKNTFSSGATTDASGCMTCIEQQKNKVDDFGSLATEVLILAFLIKKRIQRRQFFLNHSETNLLWVALRQIARFMWEPHFQNYGWYHFLESSEVLPELTEFKKELMTLMEGNPTSDPASLRASLALLVKFASMASLSPDQYASICTATNRITEDLYA